MSIFRQIGVSFVENVKCFRKKDEMAKSAPDLMHSGSMKRLNAQFSIPPLVRPSTRLSLENELQVPLKTSCTLLAGDNQKRSTKGLLVRLLRKGGKR